MDFIRKNWSRLSLAFLYLIGGVIAVVAWIKSRELITDYSEGVDKFFYIAVMIATILYFFGMVGITVMKSLANSKKIVSILYMCIGGVITVLLMVLVIVASANNASLIQIDGITAINPFYLLWVPFIVFGLHPLVKGVTRFIEAEMTPAPAKVQAVAEPATVATETAQAPAKKAAPKTPAAK